MGSEEVVHRAILDIVWLSTVVSCACLVDQVYLAYLEYLAYLVYLVYLAYLAYRVEPASPICSLVHSSVLDRALVYTAL